jgi:hypothetical protein
MGDGPFMYRRRFRVPSPDGDYIEGRFLGDFQRDAARGRVRGYTELAADLTSNTVARYNFITPNLCDDMHDTCAPTNDSIKQGDNWLSQELPKILASSAYQNGATVLITWDESEGGDVPIGMIALGKYVKVGYAGSVHYTHSSTLRTVQKIFGLSPYLGDAANATDLSDLFTQLP